MRIETKRHFLTLDAKSVVLFKLKCPSCEKWVILGPFVLAPVGQSPEKVRCTYQDICENCIHTFWVSIFDHDKEYIIDIEGIKEAHETRIEVEGYMDRASKREILSLLNTNPLENFTSQVENLKKLIKQELPTEEVQQILHKQVFASGITLLESYLSESLMTYVMSDEEYFRKFVESFNEFKDEKISVSEVYNYTEKLKNTVPEKLLGLLYHNLSRIGNIYKNVLGVEFSDFSELAKAVATRHDIVHRNGRTKDGVVIQISQSDAEILFMELVEFVRDVDKKLKANRNKK